MDTDQLKQLHELKEQGVLTEEEFSAKKAEILNEPSGAATPPVDTPSSSAVGEEKKPIAIAALACGAIAGLQFLSLEGSMIPSRGTAQLAILFGLAGIICGVLTIKKAAGPRNFALVGIIGGALGFLDGCYVESKWQEMEEAMSSWGSSMDDLVPARPLGDPPTTSPY